MLICSGKKDLPAKFVAEFHDLGAQVGGGALLGRGLVVLHRGEEQNPVVFAMSTSYMVVALATILAVVFIAFRLLSGRRRLRRGPVWAGGLRHLWPGTTYTATGFSNPVRVIFEAILQPRTASKPSPSIFDGNQAEPHGSSHRRPAGARPLDRFHGACGGYRAEDARRACQCPCGLHPLHDAVCADCRSSLF
jgi:hypothetical protein